MSWSFGMPLVLILLLGVGPLVWLGRNSLRGFSARQRRTALSARTLLLVLLVFALSDPRVRRPDDHLAVVFALDVSNSLLPQQEAGLVDWLNAALAARRPDDSVDVVAFGRGALPVDQSLSGKLPQGDATDLEDALSLAGSLLPSDGARRIVLLTDGYQNAGRAQERASQLAKDGVQISYVAPQAAFIVADVMVRALEAPAYSREGETIEVEATVESTHSTTASIRLFTDGQSTAEQQVELNRGLNRVGFSIRPRGAGFHAFRVETEADNDAIPANDSAQAFTVVKENGRTLILEQRTGESSEVQAALLETGLRLDVQPASFIPPSAEGLRAYDAVVLANVPATALSLDQQTTLQQFVQDQGKGLVVIGGSTSYALGGYVDSPLAEALPVDSSPPLRREQSSVALILVIDKSGSMELFRFDSSKMAMAREAAKLAVEALNPGDQIGVVAFDSRTQWIVNPTRIENQADIRVVQRRIATISADGGTEIFPALEAAYEAIAGLQAKLKHIVLLTDGQEVRVANYASLIALMRPQNITLTTIGIGSDADLNLLTRLAKLGDGRFYFTERPQEIPRIVTRETTIVSRNALVEGQIQPQLTEPSPLLAGLSGADLPLLGGYVATTPRPSAQTVLISDRGDPLLAHWQYGLGRVVAWTSDGRSEWSARWLAASEARKFWGQSVRWSMPQPVDPHFHVTTEVVGDHAAVRVTAAEADGRFSQGVQIVANVLTPDGQAFQLPLRQVGPGSYEINVKAPGPGAYGVEAVDMRGGSAQRREQTGFVVDDSRELRTTGWNRALLDQLARASRGARLSDPGQAFQRDTRLSGARSVPLWPWLLAGALLLLPLDVISRRLSLFRGRKR